MKANLDPERRPIRPIIDRRDHRFAIGVALGVVGDTSAVCVLEAYTIRHDPTEPEQRLYEIRHLMRYPDAMTAQEIAADVGGMMRQPPISGSDRPRVVLDQTEVGAPIAKLFSELQPVKVMIVSAPDPGSMVTSSTYNVGAQTLNALINALVQLDTLGIEFGIKDKTSLASDLRTYKIGEPPRSDYVTAVAIALWYLDKWKPALAGTGRGVRPRVLLGYGKAKGF